MQRKFVHLAIFTLLPCMLYAQRNTPQEEKMFGKIVAVVLFIIIAAIVSSIKSSKKTKTENIPYPNNSDFSTQFTKEQKAAILCGISYVLNCEGQPEAKEVQQLITASIAIKLDVQDQAFLNMADQQDQKKVIQILNTLNRSCKQWLVMVFNSVASIKKSQTKIAIAMDICNSIGVDKADFLEIVRKGNYLAQNYK